MPARKCSGAVKVIQGVNLIYANLRDIEFIAKCDKRFGNEMPRTKDEMDAVVISAFRDIIQNNKETFEAKNCLVEGEKGVKKISRECLLAAYGTAMGSLFELSEQIAKIFKALTPRYIELLSALH